MDTGPKTRKRAIPAVPHITGGVSRFDWILPIVVGDLVPWLSTQVGDAELVGKLLGRDDIRGVGVEGELFVCLDPLVIAGTKVQPKKPSTGFWQSFVSACINITQDPVAHRQSLAKMYNAFGPVTAFGAANGYESLEAVHRAAVWLQQLGRLATAMARRDSVELWQTALEASRKGRAHKLVSLGIPGVDHTELLEIPFPAVGSTKVNGKDLALALGDDNELMRRAELAVVTAVSERIGGTRMRPVEYRNEYCMAFEPRSILDVAFFDWLFGWRRSVAGVRCEGCGRLLPEHRRKWCSDRCRERVYKRAQRSKKSFTTLVEGQESTPVDDE